MDIKNRSRDDIFSIKINGALVQLRRSKVADIKGFIPRYDEDEKFMNDIKNYIKTSLSRTLLVDGKIVALGGVLAIAPRVYNSWNIVSRGYDKNRVALLKGLIIAFTQMQHYLYSNKMIDHLYALVSKDRGEAIRFNKLFGLKIDDTVKLSDSCSYVVMKKSFEFI